MIKYLCVDDEDSDSTDSYLTNLTEQEPHLDIKLEIPTSFSDEVDEIKDRIDANNYVGLMLDLRLDGPGSQARYRAPALVQEIHTRAAENAFPVCPLVLWSNDRKLNASYRPDDTSHDLFDLVIDKEKLPAYDQLYARDRARKMLALAEGYQSIKQAPATDDERALNILAIDPETFSRLDPRLVKPVTRSLTVSSVYDQARYIHRQLLSIPNSALISSEILAARLGMDIRQVENFDALAEELFPKAKYQGAFAYGWPSWWVPLIEQAWTSFEGSPGALRQLNAAQRVDFINTLMGKDNLKPAAGIEWTSSTAYWTVCQITRRPLDPRDGYVVDRQLQPWQLTQYLSMHGKMDGSREAERVKVDPLDVDRYDEEKAEILARIKK